MPLFGPADVKNGDKDKEQPAAFHSLWEKKNDVTSPSPDIRASWAVSVVGSSLEIKVGSDDTSPSGSCGLFFGHPVNFESAYVEIVW